jgi:nitrite reductase (cytochrome c-552)
MKKLMFYLGTLVLTAVMTAGVTALLLNIWTRKQEGRFRQIKVVELDESVVDPAVWGKNFPREFEGYRKTSETARTAYGGSEAYSKLDQDPVWKRFFAGYAFGLDYREERGHAYSLSDQHETLRVKEFKQPGACLQCHAGGIQNAYRELGAGNVQAGFEKMNAMPIEDAWEYAKHPVACIDCHDPETMDLRVTRPGFLNAIRLVKKDPDYDPNTMATRQEMRAYVCGQCHVEYYFRGETKQLTYPWHRGLKADEIEAYYDEIGFSDWKHAETGAPVLKAQHPEFETWNQGIHARSGVTCADCHMPYTREGALKVSDHHIRSPLTNVSRSCLPCHHFTEREMLDRAEAIQARTRALMDRAQEALKGLLDDVVAAKSAGTPESALSPALAFHRKAQWRLDFVSAENSGGFHAPHEASRLLAEAIDFARQGQLAVQRARGSEPAA